ncbi:MAG: hypothetical protein B0D92_08030 [Spirochaeta sp. LUC14_002_19_P3]|nr:MAG: hypothetical protein B0D92_08030 [Spirochaeta sp. LUC14_002_19_P3]
MPKTVTYHANAIIYFQGDKANGIFILKQGKVELSSEDIATGQKLKEMVIIGEFFGTQAAIGGSKHNETATALTECAAVFLTVKEFEALITSNSRLLMKTLQAFSNKLRRIHHQVQSCLTSDHINISQEAGLFSVGEYHLNEGQYEQAAFAFKQYLKYWPSGTYAPQAKLKAGEAQTALERSEEKKPGKKANQQASDDSVITPEYLEAQYELKKYKIALKGYLEIVHGEKYPDLKSYAEFRIGCCLYHLKQYSDSVKQMSIVLTKYPNLEQLGDAVAFLGLSYGGLNQPEKAAGFYRKACEILPESSPLYQMIIKNIRQPGGG